MPWTTDGHQWYPMASQYGNDTGEKYVKNSIFSVKSSKLFFLGLKKTILKEVSLADSKIAKNCLYNIENLIDIFKTIENKDTAEHSVRLAATASN